MSGRKKMPNTQRTASNEPLSRPVAWMSPVRSSTFASPCSRAFARPRASAGSARSMPSTEPAGPTARAAGSADAPVPQHASSTRSPGSSAARATVRRP
jgi:hypothetical protein